MKKEGVTPVRSRLHILTARCWLCQIASNRGKPEERLVISVRDHG
jgi:hypothetical protein